MRALADLYSYSSNTVVVVKATGAQIVDWLEWAARIFNRVDPSAGQPQALVNTRMPAYDFDTIARLTYQIDVTKPSGRIADVRFEGARSASTVNSPLSPTAIAPMAAAILPLWPMRRSSCAPLTPTAKRSCAISRQVKP